MTDLPPEDVARWVEDATVTRGYRTEAGIDLRDNRIAVLGRALNDERAARQQAHDEYVKAYEHKDADAGRAWKRVDELRSFLLELSAPLCWATDGSIESAKRLMTGYVDHLTSTLAEVTRQRNEGFIAHANDCRKMLFAQRDAAAVRARVQHVCDHDAYAEDFDDTEPDGVRTVVPLAKIRAALAPTDQAEVTHFVVGFALDHLGRVALIRKTRPDWQAGLLNGIGGHVEDGESPEAAMVREFEEETGTRLDGWEPVVQMTFPGAVIHFYRARTTADVLDGLRTTTDEEVHVADLGSLAPQFVVPNLAWLLPLAAYTADTYEPIHVTASVAEALHGAEVAR